MTTKKTVKPSSLLFDEIVKDKRTACFSGSPDKSLEATKLKYNTLVIDSSDELGTLLSHLLGTSSSEDKCKQLQEYLPCNEDNEVISPDKFIRRIFGYEIGISRIEFFDWLTKKKFDYSKWKHVIAYFMVMGFPEVRDFLSVIIKSQNTEVNYRGRIAVDQLTICADYDTKYLVEHPLPSNFSPEPTLKKQSRKLRVAFVNDKFATNLLSSQKILQDIIFSGLPDDIEIWLFLIKSHDDKYTESYRQRSDHFIDLSGLSYSECKVLIDKAEIDIVVDPFGSIPYSYWELFEDSIRVGLFHIASYVKNFYHYILDEKDSFPQWQKKFANLSAMENSLLLPIPAKAQINPSIPSRTNRYITFGCFSRLIKIHPINYDTWAKLLNEVRRSRIAFSFMQLNATLQYIMLKEFKQRGIGSDRIAFFDRTDSTKHLTKYNSIDLVLDTFPVASSFSLTDALWMGVPIVTLHRKLDYAGVTEKSLKRLGRESWIANNEREYIDICKKLASDSVYRKTLKSTLRQDLINSDLLDGKKFSKEMYEHFKKLADDNRR